MKQKEITIGGQTYPVAFTLKTIDGFERITSTPFSTANLDLTHNRMALILAAALTADENTKLTAEAIIGDGDLKALKQITAATTTIMELVTEFFEVGKLDVSDAPATTEDNTEGDDEEPKN